MSEAFIDSVADARTPDQLHDEGVTWYRRQCLPEALRCYDQALALRPDFAMALNSRGFVLQDLGRLQEATEDFSRAVALAPDLAMARLNLGMAQLKAGQMAQGWDNYEARWMGAAEAKAGLLSRPALPVPMWTGQGGTQGQRLLVITEQGFGDTFQFSRYVPMAQQRFVEVGFAVSPPTQRLMEWSYPGVPTMTRLPASADAWRAWDYHCPMMSLPKAFGTRLDTIPAQVPYLRVPEAVARHWGERVARVAPGRLRVGIAWQGRKAHQCDARRSLRFEQLRLLLGDPRIHWFSLQRREPDEPALSLPPGVAWTDWTREGSEDFADAAALITQLDLVISIDSAMAHLAGGLARPVWLLDRFDNEWRWLTGRDDSPWYPTLRIFRQPAFGDWASVLDRVAQALGDLPMPRQAPVGSVDPSAGGLSVEQALQQAARHHAQGQAADAEALLRQILTKVPGHAAALHLLGVVLYQAGHAVAGIASIERAVAQAPSEALFRSNLAEMCRQQGRLDEAISHGQQAVELAPEMACAWSNLGVACHDAGQLDRAQACQERAIGLDARLVPALNSLGSIARARQDLPGAADWYRRALTVQPDHLEALSNLGAVLVESGDVEAAQAPLEHAVRRKPDYAEALCNLGLVRLKQSRCPEAIALLRRCLTLRPAYPEAMVGLALALHDSDQTAQARQWLDKVVALRPDKHDAWCHLGTVCQEMGDIDLAEQAYRRALALVPRHADALTGIGNIRLEQGRFDEASDMLGQAIAADPEHLGARFHLVQTRKVGAEDDNVAYLQGRLPRQNELGADQRVALHYALGKAHDDRGQWDQAFAHYLQGAGLKRSLMRYDEAAEERLFQQIMAIVDRDFIARFHGQGHPDDCPVFVLGMPRSGTTLTEQIIASHPQAHGAGELQELMSVLNGPAGNTPGPFPANLAGLDAAALARWGQDYAARLRRRAPQALRITDKLPGNYIAMGMIPLMLPRARIIHVRRNAVDTCVSCFTRLFNRHQEPTYDLAELGRHYTRYARLMAHWRAVLPADSFIEVQYEDVVADMPRQARRLIEFVGLPWDEACLDFHRNPRRIRTSSVTQVRQPIYKSSVERWRHYEHHLQPLLAALGSLAHGR